MNTAPPISVSVAAICKNEEAWLPAFLAAVAPWADEVVIVDTGSTDGSLTLLQRAALNNPKIKFCASRFFNSHTPLGEFRFNVARNEALSYCTGDWVVVLDPDFDIPPEFGIAIRGTIMGAAQPTAFEIYLEGDGMRYAQCRVWPSGQAQYDPDHSAHEFVITQLPVKQLPELVVGHRGRPGQGSAQALAILEADYRRGLRSSRLLYNLARAQYDSRRWGPAEATYREFLGVVRLGDWMHYYGQLQLARTLYWIDLGKAWYEALEALQIDSLRAEAYCLLGDIALASGNMKEQARHWYKLALILRPPTGSRYHEAACYDVYPRHQLRRLAEGKKGL
jgi:glycosyltransferase involved in cell wall biosynthesis